MPIFHEYRYHTWEWLHCLPQWHWGNRMITSILLGLYDGVIKWKHFSRYWPFVWGIHGSPLNSPYKGQWRGALMFSLICAWINAWINNREAGDLRRYRARYDVIVMIRLPQCQWCNPHISSLRTDDLTKTKHTKTVCISHGIHLIANLMNSLPMYSRLKFMPKLEKLSMVQRRPAGTKRQYSNLLVCIPSIV